MSDEGVLSLIATAFAVLICSAFAILVYDFSWWILPVALLILAIQAVAILRDEHKPPGGWKRRIRRRLGDMAKKRPWIWLHWIGWVTILVYSGLAIANALLFGAEMLEFTLPMDIVLGIVFRCAELCNETYPRDPTDNGPKGGNRIIHIDFGGKLPDQLAA